MLLTWLYQLYWRCRSAAWTRRQQWVSWRTVIRYRVREWE